MIPIMVVACNKNHELLGIDMFKVDTLKLINSIKVEENSRIVKRLQSKHSFKRKTITQAIWNLQKLPICILSIVVAKFFF